MIIALTRAQRQFHGLAIALRRKLPDHAGPRLPAISVCGPCGIHKEDFRIGAYCRMSAITCPTAFLLVMLIITR